MKKIIGIFLVVLVLLSLCAVTALAVSAEPELLRAGGGGGGGFGGGGSFRHFRSIRSSDMPLAAKIGYYVLSFLLFAVHLAVAVITPIILIKRKRKAKKESRMRLNEYDDFDGSWSYDYIQKRVKEVYFAVQNAWTKGNMKNIEDMLSEKLFEKFQKHLKAMKRDHERNVLKNIRLIRSEPVLAKDFADNRHDYFWCLIEGSMIDYTVNTDSGIILQGSEKDGQFIEYWKFTRGDYGSWVLYEILQKEEFEQDQYYKGLIT